MLDNFLQHKLAQIDDLTELKVSLVAMRLLEQKQSETSSITADELAQHPSLQNGLGFAPEIALNSALQRAVARGTLLACESPALVEPRYFASNNASRRMIDALQQSAALSPAQQALGSTQPVQVALEHEIERLEQLAAYRFTPEDKQLLGEWLAQGYSSDEVMSAVKSALSMPRLRGTPARDLTACISALNVHPPVEPSEYYQVVVTRLKSPPDEVIAFRDLAGRWPNGHEYQLIRAGVGLYGAIATIQVMRRHISTVYADMDAVLPLLAEQQEAELTSAREVSVPDQKTQELLRLYESSFGLPATSNIAHDINMLSSEITDPLTWRRIFEYALQRNKRDWAYVRKLLQNPSPTLFEPEPANDAARFAFKEYKRRVSFGVLDGVVAQEINEVAKQITDTVVWQQAIDTAARNNALNWNYIKKVLTGSATRTGEEKDGKRKQVSYGRGRGVSRRQQVEDATEAEREAARERARKSIEERAKRRASKNDAN